MGEMEQLEGLAWRASAGSKTERYECFHEMHGLVWHHHPIAILCRQGLDADTEAERSQVCEEILALVVPPLEHPVRGAVSEPPQEPAELVE